MLTEQELLAMPEQDYMNAAQLEFFKQRLRNDYQHISVEMQQAKRTLSHIEETPDPFDSASCTEMQQLELRKMERLTKLLHKIEASLRDIEQNRYGYCRESGEPIGLARLLARPTATLSVEAKQRQEYMEHCAHGDDD